jgi:peroxiredoxin
MRKNISLILFIGLIGLVFSAFTEGGLNVGDKAPDFKLKNIDGKVMSLSDIDNVEGYIVVFTCNTCPTSVMYEDRIIEANKKFAPMGYPVVAINPNDVERRPGDSFEEMKIRAKEKGFDFPYLYDETQEVAISYGATRTPHVFLLDKDLTVQYIGAIDNNSAEASEASEFYLEDAVNALKSGGKPDPNFTKAIGCTIKWKTS